MKKFTFSILICFILGGVFLTNNLTTNQKANEEQIASEEITEETEIEKNKNNFTQIEQKFTIEEHIQKYKEINMKIENISNQIENFFENFEDKIIEGSYVTENKTEIECKNKKSFFSEKILSLSIEDIKNIINTFFDDKINGQISNITSDFHSELNKFSYAKFMNDFSIPLIYYDVVYVVSYQSCRRILFLNSCSTRYRDFQGFHVNSMHHFTYVLEKSNEYVTKITNLFEDTVRWDIKKKKISYRLLYKQMEKIQEMKSKGYNIEAKLLEIYTTQKQILKENLEKTLILTSSQNKIFQQAFKEKSNILIKRFEAHFNNPAVPKFKNIGPHTQNLRNLYNNVDTLYKEIEKNLNEIFPVFEINYLLKNQFFVC